MTVLETVDEVDPGWLAEVLGRPVDRVEVDKVGTGQMGDAYRLRLDPTGTPATVVLKLASTDPTSRATGLALRAYEVEVRFYREVATTLDVRVPACFHADVDASTGAFTLLLEDLAPAQQGDHFAGVDVPTAALVMTELARLHGPRWDDPALADLEWLNRQTPQSQEFTAGLVASLWPGFQDRYGEQLTPDEVEVCSRLMACLGPFLQQRRGPFSVVHGDYRLDNMLFGGPAGPSPLTVVDWQTAVWGQPLTDAAYFLAGAFADPQVRRMHEEELLRGYHDGLLGYGVSGFSWDDCWTEYRRSSFSTVVMAVASAMLVERTERGDRMFLTALERGCAQVRDLDALELLP